MPPLKKTDRVITHVETKKVDGRTMVRALYAGPRGRRLPGRWVGFQEAASSPDFVAFLREHDGRQPTGKED